MCSGFCEFWSYAGPWLAQWYPAIIGAAVLAILCSPRLTLKIAAWIIRLVLFRLRVVGKENMPYSGPILLVSNHVSLVDLLMIQAVVRQRVRFLMLYPYKEEDTLRTTNFCPHPRR